jgi:putative chitinase
VITLDELKKIMPYAGRRAEFYIDHLNSAMDEFGIDTPQRQAAFLAQIAHESGSLNYVKELASGKDYEGRKDLGNVESGDGVRFKGRGLIQLTGRAWYERFTRECGIDVVTTPELLETPELATRSAAWFWSINRLNEWADKGDFLRITKIVNGGTNGYQDRLSYYERANAVLS